jgi:hypothetical protein
MDVRMTGRLQRLSSGVQGVQVRLRPPRAPEPDGEYEGALRGAVEALGCIRSAGGKLRAASDRLASLEDPEAPPRQRLEALVTTLARVQDWLRATIDDLTAVGENNAAAKSDLPEEDAR